MTKDRQTPKKAGLGDQTQIKKNVTPPKNPQNWEEEAFLTDCNCTKHSKNKPPNIKHSKYTKQTPHNQPP